MLGATTGLRALADVVVGAEEGTIAYERQLERATTKIALSHGLKGKYLPTSLALEKLRFFGVTRGWERPNDQL
jgi:hypothetical protein